MVAIGIAVFAGIAAAGLAGDGLQTGPSFFAVTTNPFVDALFGAPIAHEDHAQRACCGALAARHVRKYANEVRVRHGIPFGCASAMARLKAGASSSEINRELTILKRSFNLGP